MPSEPDTTQARPASQDDTPFYVGYLPLPAAVRRFLLPWVAANAVFLLAVGVLLAQQQRDPGDGTWDTSRPVTMVGYLTTDPYPLLRVPDAEAPSGMTTYILTQQSKRGVGEMTAGLDGRLVEVTGFVIERQGRRVLELDGTHPAPINTAVKDRGIVDRDDLPRPVSLGGHTLVGEIVDPKCYLGAMKPGEGKPHKVCATLCITGGIPPVFVVRDEAGNTTTYLLMTADGDAFPPSHYEYIADAIELRGKVERQGDLLVLRAEMSTIRRLE